MLSSIHPLGERARHSRWWLTVSAYVLASGLGGLTVGVLAGAAGWALALVLPWSAALVLAVVACGAAVAADLGGVSLPCWRRQVNEDWLDLYRGWVYGAGFGYQLGTGVVTYITTAFVPLTWLLAVLSGSVAGGAVVGLVFGLARGLVLTSTRSITSPERLSAFHRRLAATAVPARRLSVVVATAATIVLVGVQW